MHQIYYLCVDPEKALGVEDLIPSYHIIYSETSQLAHSITNKGASLLNPNIKKSSKSLSTADLFESEIVRNYVKSTSHGIPDILVFKNDKQITERAKNLGWNLLNPSFEVNKKFENKINFSKFLDEIELFSKPKYIVIDELSKASYEQLVKLYGTTFVLQFMLGHSGNSTYFIESREQFDELKTKYPKRKAKAVQKIEGIPYTVNACIVRGGVIVGGLTEQITGIEEFTSSKGSTVGNDFTQRHLDDFLRSEIISKTIEFGEILRKEGHKGIFGLDFIVNYQEKNIYLIEANIRQTASVPYTSYLQRMQLQMPIMLWHILELLDFDYTNRFDCMDDSFEEIINNEITSFRLANDKLDYNLDRNKPYKASQIFLRNNKSYDESVLEQFPSGIYRIRGRNPQEASLLESEAEDYPAVYRLREDGWSTLCLINRGYNIIEARDEDGFLILSAAEKNIIQPFGEIARIQVLESAFGGNEDTKPSGWIYDVMNSIQENSRLIKFEE